MKTLKNINYTLTNISNNEKYEVLSFNNEFIWLVDFDNNHIKIKSSDLNLFKIKRIN
jgi:hypothetical protein